MLNVLGWADVAIAGVCVCVRSCRGSLEAVGDALCIINSMVKGYSNKRLRAIQAELLDETRNTAR